MSDDLRLQALLSYPEPQWVGIKTTTVVRRARRIRRRRIAAGVSSVALAAAAATTVGTAMATHIRTDEPVSNRAVTAAELATATAAYPPIGEPAVFMPVDGVTPIAWVYADGLCQGFIGQGGASTCQGWGPTTGRTAVLPFKPVFQAANAKPALGPGGAALSGAHSLPVSRVSIAPQMASRSPTP